MGGTLTTVYIRIGAFLPINPSPTTLCVCHSGFLIVSEYFPDDWCINDVSITEQTTAKCNLFVSHNKKVEKFCQSRLCSAMERLARHLT